MNDEHDAKKRLKEQYAAMADDQESPRTDTSRDFDPIQHAKSIGYSEEDISSVPQGVICLGCGNPIALAELREGETVLDLGAGGGFDAFLAAQRVGPTGKVVGVDMTAEMVAKATANAQVGKYTNTEFRLGEIERLPVDSGSVDVVISNCVISHCPDKLATFQEIRRCLKPGGRMLIADLVRRGEFSQEALNDKLWGHWLAVACGKEEYLNAIERAGFREINVVGEQWSSTAEKNEHLRGRIVSIQVRALK